jgi:hypothetical protein
MFTHLNGLWYAVLAITIASLAFVAWLIRQAIHMRLPVLFEALIEAGPLIVRGKRWLAH